MEPEEWRQIEEAPDYAISSNGSVKRLTPAPGTFAGKILAQSCSANGYRQVNLMRDRVAKTTKVHLLVALAFHGPRPSAQHQVAHRDGNKDNNVATNLRWALPVDNAADDLSNGRRLRGERHKLAILTERQVLEIRASKLSPLELAARYGVTRSAIYHVVRRELWKHLP